jgi:hypothetical protein
MPAWTSPSPGGQLSLVPRRTGSSTSRALADSVAVEGRVTDQASGAPIVGAAITVLGEPGGAVTAADGRFRLTGLAPGTHTLQVRFIGYTPVERVVVVGEGAGPPIVLDVALTRTIPQMAQLVVTGTVIPTEERALPTPSR